MIKNNKYILLVFIAICFLATGGVFVKLSSLGPINTGFYRVAISLLILFPFTYKELKMINLKEEKRAVLLMLLAGIFLAGDLILWNTSFHYTTIANANLLANLVPLTMIPFSYYFFKEKIKASFFGATLLTFIGVFVLIIGKTEINSNNLLGDFLAFLTSIFYSLFLLTVYKIRKVYSSTIILFISGIGSTITLFVFSTLIERIQYPTGINSFLPLLGVAIFSQVLGQGLLAYAIKNISSSLSSVLVLTQPVIAAIYAFILFNENLTFVEMFGIIITLIGVFFAKKTN